MPVSTTATTMPDELGLQCPRRLGVDAGHRVVQRPLLRVIGVVRRREGHRALDRVGILDRAHPAAACPPSAPAAQAIWGESTRNTQTLPICRSTARLVPMRLPSRDSSAAQSGTAPSFSRTISCCPGAVAEGGSADAALLLSDAACGVSAHRTPRSLRSDLREAAIAALSCGTASARSSAPVRVVPVSVSPVPTSASSLALASGGSVPAAAV